VVIGVESFQYPCAILIPPTAAVNSQSFWFVSIRLSLAWIASFELLLVYVTYFGFKSELF